MATLYKANGDKVRVEPASGQKFSAEEIYRMLNSINVEVIFLKEGRYMLIDKNAKDRRLDINPWATKIFHTSLRMNMHDWIAGDALVCDPSEF